MENKSPRSFRPDPTPRRADGLKDRMRTSAHGRPQPSNTRRTTPPSGEFVPPEPVVRVPHQQDPAVREEPIPIEPNYPPDQGNASLIRLPKVNLPSFLKIPSKLRLKKPHFSTSRLSKVNKKVVIASAAGFGVFILISVAGIGAFYTYSTKNPAIPVSTVQKIDYKLLYPAKDNQIKVDESTFQFEDQDSLLSYIGYTPQKNKLVVTQQAQPKGQGASKQGFDFLLQRLQVYKTIKTANGDVSLTRPTQFKGDQFAVMRTNDSLLFIRPAKEVKENQWKDIFDSFKPVKQSE